MEGRGHQLRAQMMQKQERRSNEKVSKIIVSSFLQMKHFAIWHGFRTNCRNLVFGAQNLKAAHLDNKGGLLHSPEVTFSLRKQQWIA